MEIIDPSFRKLPLKSKIYIVFIGLAFLAIALLAYYYNITTPFESFLLFAVGMLFVELLKIDRRIKKLEKKR